MLYNLFGLSRWCEVLVSLLTLDVKTFGEEALSKVQLVKVTCHSTSTTATLPLSSPPPTMTPRMPSMTPLSKRNCFSVNVMKKDKSGINPGSKPTDDSQTIKIGNVVIPVMSMTNLFSQGRVAASSASAHGQAQQLPSVSSVSAKHSLSSQGQSVVIPTSLVQGLPSSSNVKMSSSLTIQLLQNLLSLSHIPSAMPPSKRPSVTPTSHIPSTTPLVSPSNTVLGGGSNVPANHSGSGGSGVTIRKVGVVPVGENNSKDKPFSNLLRSYLAKNVSTSTTASSSSSFPQAVPPSSSANVGGSLPKHSTRSTTPSPTPSSLSSSSASSLCSSVGLLEPFASQW